MLTPRGSGQIQTKGVDGFPTIQIGSKLHKRPGGQAPERFAVSGHELIGDEPEHEIASLEKLQTKIHYLARIRAGDFPGEHSASFADALRIALRQTADAGFNTSDDFVRIHSDAYTGMLTELTTAGLG
jgi:hypothetical protein